MFNQTIRLFRDMLLDLEPAVKKETKRLEFPLPEEAWLHEKSNYIPEKLENFEYSLPLEEWLAEFKVGIKVIQDTDTETKLKDLEIETAKRKKEIIIQNSQKYCRLNHTTKTL